MHRQSSTTNKFPITVSQLIIISGRFRCRVLTKLQDFRKDWQRRVRTHFDQVNIYPTYPYAPRPQHLQILKKNLTISPISLVANSVVAMLVLPKPHPSLRALSISSGLL